MSPEHKDKDRRHVKRPIDLFPQDYPLTNERVIAAIHEGKKDYLFKKKKITGDQLKDMTADLMQGIIPGGYGTAEEFEDFIEGILDAEKKSS
ncbi:hypothetical protein IID22_01410 [Patescibacteria group bacterium]|nr:hypothetical protein [Patescibacteria group bacterium]